MCSLAPASISQFWDWTFNEQEITVFIPEEEGMEEGKEMTWLVLVGLMEDAEESKDDCWIKDTRWTCWSWVKPVWEIAEKPSVVTWDL